MNTQFKRRRYIVNWTLQSHFTLYSIGLVDCMVCIAYVTAYWIIAHMLHSYASPAVYQAAREIVMPAIFYSFIVTMIITSAVTAVVAIRYSHRIAGPMYRLERICNHVSDGDLTIRVGFRKNDLLRPLKVALQDMITGLQEKIQGIHAELAALEELKHHMRTTPLDDASFTRLENFHTSLNRKLDSFKFNVC